MLHKEFSNAADQPISSNMNDKEKRDKDEKDKICIKMELESRKTMKKTKFSG